MSIVASAAERKKLLEEVESIFHAPLPAEPNYDEVDLIIGERRQRVRRRAALGTVSRCCKHVRWNERVRVLGESDNMVVLCSDCDHVSTAGSDAESNDEKLADVGTDSLHQAGPPGFDDHGLEAMRVSVEPDILEGTKNFSYLHYTLGRYVRFFLQDYQKFAVNYVEDTALGACDHMGSLKPYNLKAVRMFPCHNFAD